MTASVLAPRLVQAAAEGTLAMALVVVVAGLAHAADPRRGAAGSFATALGLGLEFLLAGGLLRLALSPSYAALGITALIIAVRTIIKTGLRFAVRTAAAQRG